MNREALKNLVSLALTNHSQEVFRHLDSLGKGGYGGIERIFERSILDQLGITIYKQRTCEDIGSFNYMRRSDRGFVDLVLPLTGEPVSAFEFKAVRMPRIKADCCFDISQISSDYLRLANATKISRGWIIAFVYGPLVDDATSTGDLLRRFHNQMFIEFTLSVATGKLGDDWGSEQIVACEKLGWASPMVGAKNEDHRFGVLAKADLRGKTRSIGAVCFRAL